MDHSSLPWSVVETFTLKKVLVDANGKAIPTGANAPFIVAAVNAFEPREDLIRKLITALADVRDREPSAWSALQENALDLSREMGF